MIVHVVYEVNRCANEIRSAKSSCIYMNLGLAFHWRKVIRALVVALTLSQLIADRVEIKANQF